MSLGATSALMKLDAGISLAISCQSQGYECNVVAIIGCRTRSFKQLGCCVNMWNHARSKKYLNLMGGLIACVWSGICWRYRKKAINWTEYNSFRFGLGDCVSWSYLRHCLRKYQSADLRNFVKTERVTNDGKFPGVPRGSNTRTSGVKLWERIAW